MTAVHRPARTAPPADPGGSVPLAAPPALGDDAGGWGWYTYLFPVVGSLGALVFVAINPNPVYLVGGLIFVLGAGGMGIALFLQQRGRTRTRLADQRRRYLAHLAEARAALRAAAERQRAAARWRHPEPAALAGLVRDPARLWERRPGDDDFLQPRVGRGAVPAAGTPELAPRTDPLREPDPLCRAALDRLLAAHAAVGDVPVAVPLRDRPVVSVVGEDAAVRAVGRALLTQLAALHAPEDLRIAVQRDPDDTACWEWVKWLPHAQHPEEVDDSGSRRLVAADPGELEALLGAELAARRSRSGSKARAAPALVVLLDRLGAERGAGLLGALDGPAPPGTAVIHLVGTERDEPSHVDVRLHLGPDGTFRMTGDGGAVTGRADAPGTASAGAVARGLAPLRLAETGDRPLSATADLPGLLGVADVARVDPAQRWRRRPERERLTVPIGVDARGAPVVLDLKESALGGMGPHGLCVGATGSGKSELLRTLVTGLALCHPPDELAFVLVDYKGGAAFTGLSGLPHTAGIITNIEDDETLADRMHEALFGEIARRQQVLRAAGHLAGIREYGRLRDTRTDLPPLPSLLVIVDEFSELLAAKPDFIDLFVAVGRLGRSLGVHLLLATQRLEEGRLRGLESHLSYRIGLRTFSAVESRIVLGTPDAYELPPVPGSAYLKVDTSVHTRLRTATVSIPYVPPRPAGTAPDRRPVLPFPARSPRTTADPSPAFSSELPDPSRRSVLDVAVGRLSGAAERVSQVWLPPLPAALGLDALLPPLQRDPGRGLRLPDWPEGRLTVPLGLVDLPREQRQQLLVADLAGHGGNLAVVGGPRTGKSTALRTLSLALACTHTPAEVQLYCLDLGGGLLAPLAGLPHVGGVAGRLDRDRVARVVAEVRSLLEHRERYFPPAGIDSVATFRQRRRAGTLPEDRHGDVFLLIDNWPALRTEYEELEPVVLDLASRGLSYGVHVVVTAGRWLDLRPNLRDCFGTRLELRLGEPADTVHDRQEARRLPALPGRALVPGSRVAQLALPRMPGQPAGDDPGAEVRDAVAHLAAAWTGPPAPPVRMLPTRLPHGRLGEPPSGALALGVAETDLAPVHVDLLGAEPHLLVLGDGESGKTTVLRGLLAGMVSRFPPERVRILVVDYRRTLLGVVPDSHLLGYAGAAPAARDMAVQLAAKLADRQPGPDLTVTQLRERSWWSGPEAVLVVDDYDLVSTGPGSPLEPLVEFLPHARDLGFHLVLTRRVGGMARAAYEPLLRRLRELDVPTFLMSGSRDEGPLVDGHRAGPLVPGRGLLVRRRHRPVLVQAAMAPEEEPAWS